LEAISIHSFFHLVFVAFIALFPPINPIGTAFIVGPFFRGHSKSVRSKSALTIAMYCLSICLITSVIGVFIFKLFGLSVPVVQMAGGFLIARMGMQILSKDDDTHDQEKVVDEGSVQASTLKSHLFYPLAFPTTTGGGTMAVLLTLSANSFDEDRQIYLFNLSATVAALLLMCGLIYICYYSAPAILDRLDAQAVQVCNKLSGFLTLAVGLQIIVNGVLKLIETVFPVH
jgi:multiple antibiotic resistance protein